MESSHEKKPGSPERNFFIGARSEGSWGSVSKVFQTAETAGTPVVLKY